MANFIIRVVDGKEILVPEAEFIAGIAIQGSGAMLGLTPAKTASISLSALRVVTSSDSDELVYASNTNRDHAFRTMGLLLEAIGEGELATPMAQGTISDPGWNWDCTLEIYLGENGFLTQAPLTDTAVFLLPVATAIQPTQIYFRIQESALL